MPQVSGKPAPLHSDLQGIEHLMLSHSIGNPTEPGAAEWQLFRHDAVRANGGCIRLIQLQFGCLDHDSYAYFVSRTLLLLFSVTSLLLPASIASAQNLPDTTRLLRFPTTDDRRIVFCYAGELYTVGKDGGVARRLTSGPGYSSFPRFSPDGKQLAFTSQYDGNTEVYVMPGEGGVPKRLTTSATLGRDDISDRMGPNNIVMTWENTKPLIVFRSRMKSFNDFIGQLFTVGMDAELPQQLPVPRGGFVSFSPDDSKMAFNRVFREFRTWKHYRGGMADDVWIYDFKTGTIENLTNNPAQDICPMWGPDNHIYFISDRDGRMNLFSIDLASKQTKQLTTFKDFDIKFPSIGKDSIVFEQAGYIWRYDLGSGRARPCRSRSRKISRPDGLRWSMLPNTLNQ